MKKGTLSIVLGLLLIVAAFSLTGYNIWDDSRAGQEARKILDQLLPEISADPVPVEGRMNYSHTHTGPISEDRIEYPDYVLNPEMNMPVRSIDGEEYIGIISVPSIAVELPVFSEWNYDKLASAPCRYTGSVYLDNMVICAHNFENHFGLLKDLRYGDTVCFTDIDGNVFNFNVTEIEYLDPAAIYEMMYGDWDLTLFTCTLGGNARIAVRCDRTDT